MNSCIEVCKQSKQASSMLVNFTTEIKNQFLNSLANNIRNRCEEIISYNKKDLENGQDLSKSILDRLTLNQERIEALALSIHEIENLPDPVGEITNGTRRPNGLLVYQERVPLGVVMVIYESRPNVTVDIAALSIKSGNSAILKGGKESLYTNQILLTIIQDSLRANGLPEHSVQLIETSDRDLIKEYLQQDQWIDVVVPRGGEQLIQWVSEHSRVPVIKHDKGLCHLFIDVFSDQNPSHKKMVFDVTINSKVQRPGVCNAIETLLIHNSYPHTEELLSQLSSQKVELRLDKPLHQEFPQYLVATEDDWSSEYTDLILSVKKVANVKEAVDWINRYGSHHTDVILSHDHDNITYFKQNVDSSCVVVNTSSRFNDGGMLGLGAEVGISNQKLHVRGPMGIRDLTCLKYQVEGNGQIRQ